MNPAPPRSVVWLLKRLGSSPKNRALVGDILEKGAEGLRKSWYWRQIFHALTAGSFQEIRSAKLLSALAAVTGWACLVVLYSLFCAASSFMPLFLRLPPESDVQPLYLAIIVGWVSSIPLTVFCFAMSGWLVAKLNRSRQMAMVLAFLSSVMLVDLTLISLIG
jgi:hypothetical protein